MMSIYPAGCFPRSRQDTRALAENDRFGVDDAETFMGGCEGSAGVELEARELPASEDCAGTIVGHGQVGSAIERRQIERAFPRPAADPAGP